MTDYYLTTQGMRIVKTNDAGNVTYRRDYTKGEKVDVEQMDPARVDALVESGDLVTKEADVTSDDDEDKSRFSVQATALTGPVGAEAVDSVGNPVTPAGEPAERTGGGGNDNEDSENVDEFSAMDYRELQEAAKERDLSAVGSASDLRARLRAS